MRINGYFRTERWPFHGSYNQQPAFFVPYAQPVLNSREKGEIQRCELAIAERGSLAAL
jgi:hypothetical protein